MSNINPNTSANGGSIDFVEQKILLTQFDSEFGFSNIIIQYNEASNDRLDKNNVETNPLDVDGIVTLLLKLNNKVTFPRQIYSLIIYKCSRFRCFLE